MIHCDDFVQTLHTHYKKIKEKLAGDEYIDGFVILEYDSMLSVDFVNSINNTLVDVVGTINGNVSHLCCLPESLRIVFIKTKPTPEKPKREIGFNRE
ncbi:hypothetical protein HQ585_00640 [candidate division KSB1 bacterium]|nr:hypothetical protein [candidate division KSB1 bacterium]